MIITNLILFLENHQTLMYLVLFFGAYFETLIGTSLLIHGEFFFLAGAILAGIGQANLWLILVVLYGGGFLGDHSSYWIGRHWGDKMYVYLQNKFFFRRYFTKSNYDKSTTFFNKYGGWSVFFGRFLGPVSWVISFLAGVCRLSYVKFTIFNFPAVIIGIGQFIVIGYFFGKNYQATLAILQQYILIALFTIICTVFFGYYYRRLLRKWNFTIKESILHYLTQLRSGKRVVIKHTLRTTVLAVLTIFILYVTSIIIIFFIENQQLNGIIEPDLKNSFDNYEEIIQSIDSSTYYKNGTKNVEPINVILITDKSLDELLTKSGWVKNKTFIRDKVGFISYAEQASNYVLPISDLYFKGVPQDFAYQYPSNSLNIREHVRVWNYGTYKSVPVYVLSVSKDHGFNLYRNLSFLIPFHAIEPHIDASRDMLTKSILKTNVVMDYSLKLSFLGKIIKTNENEEDLFYYTDGLISVIKI